MSFKTFIAAALVIATLASAAHANDAARFELRNVSGQPIDEIHVVPAGAAGLGADLLGDRVLRNGGVVAVTPGGSGCHYNVQVAYHDGATEWFRNIDLCQTTRISFANSSGYTRN